MADIGIVYFSMYGSTLELAREIAAGVREAGGTAHLRRLPHDLPDDVAESEGVAEAQDDQDDIPYAEVEELTDFDGVLFGSGTRFGSATAQLQKFFDQCGPLWAEGELIGTPAGFFTGAATLHGGHESTILSMSTFAYHQGMPIVPMGYSHEATNTTDTGGGPYGPSQLSPQDGSKDGLSDDEIAIARAYGARFHDVATRLAD
ncbi:NAD(P)H:quinone oxidoreductase [Salsipaludibacter albus]|uniref:NAD(P)H:quinone oxidoreductase n=1 Tax=Salsipaludibacter albus TaxID=2849650 RepID=UPI001EE43AD2|nr:NAD(P)H:quinone oxidoreductase [Salsipaludibacter albus]MBY5161447.1 NAD(P)H:quinone oxidoreductase [Salsipaludibacter albus]